MNKAPVLIRCICANYDFEPFYSPNDTEHKTLYHSYECDAYNEGRGHQRDADHKHYQGIIREIFEEISNEFSIEGNRIPAPCGWDKFIIRREDWQSLKSKYVEEEDEAKEC